VSDERIRELEKAYQDSGDEADGWAWAEARLRSEVSNMDLVKRIMVLEARVWKLPERPSPTPQEVAAWIDKVNPPPVELCPEHELPKPCKSCTYADRVDDCMTVAYLLLPNRFPGTDEVRRVFAASDDVRVYEQTPDRVSVQLVGQGGYVSLFPEGMVVALILGTLAWDAFDMSQRMERPITTTLEASGRHLMVRSDPDGRVGVPLLTGPQLRRQVPTWKPKPT